MSATGPSDTTDRPEAPLHFMHVNAISDGLQPRHEQRARCAGLPGRG